MFNFKKLQKFIIPIISLSLLILIIYLANTLPHIGKNKVFIAYAPFESSVFLDDNSHPLSNNSDNWIEPGTHQLLVYLNGFEIVLKQIEITDETTSIIGSLIPNSEIGENSFTASQTDYGIVEQTAGQESHDEYIAQEKIWPIAKYLPYTTPSYGIGYDLDLTTNETLYLTITASDYFVDTAVNKLRSFDKSISLAQYPLRINDFNNLLEGKFTENSETNPKTALEVGFKNLEQPFYVDTYSEKDSFAYATIVVNVDRHSDFTPQTYRVVLQKTNGAWQLVCSPYPILNNYNTTNVPQYIIDAANQLDANY